eukprot:TRINITY_DN6427_c0_g1_i13.p1 TRINITY_DN6427_c0_g1~~TRINITY_DN6427_c0_g1_i13.p1  ORF type:complete len:275 (+),score=33.94 TRINITY_DN6427_c0_g1_i13:100-924(+)
MQQHRDGCCGKTLILGICFLLGLTFFFCGISQSTNREALDRKRMIQRYNKMVKDWNSKHREDYAKIEHAYVSIENYTLSMLQSNTNVEFMTDPQEDIEQSDSFKLSASIAPGSFHHKIEPYEKFSLQVKVVDSQRKSILYLPALSFVRSRIIQSRTHKECYNAHRGTVFSHDNSCRIHELLSSVCIKISRVKPKIAKDRIWKTDERYGGIGCVPGVDGDWPISQYRILPATSAKDWIPPKSVRLLPFTIQVCGYLLGGFSSRIRNRRTSLDKQR